MAYTINLTDGSIYATISDGTIDTSSSITIVGRNYTGYGEFIAENFIRMLEHGADTTAPSNPLIGQLWYDKTGATIKVYDGSTFKDLGALSPAATEPTGSAVGDMWFDTVDSQLKIWDGTEFILIGGEAGAGIGITGAKVATITDTLAADHVILKLYIDDVVVATVSKDAEFTPEIGAEIPDFAATIKPGIQLAEIISGQVPQFIGDATNALTLDGNVAADFLSSTANDTTTGSIGILSDDGLTVGVGSDAELKVVTGDHVHFSNTTNGSDLVLQVNSGAGAAPVITLAGATGRASVTTPTAATNQIANANYVDSSITAAIATIGTTLDPRYVNITGGDTMTGALIIQNDLTISTGGQLLIEDGTAAIPSLAFSQDAGQDTGLYSQTDGYINFATDGTEKVRIEPNGTIAVNSGLNYETLVTNDDDIPNRKYVTDLVDDRWTGIDSPVDIPISMQTVSNAAWQTVLVDASAKFAVVVGETYSIASAANNGQQRLYARKKGLTGTAGVKWSFTYGGGGANTSTGEFHVSSGATIVECNASGQIELYGFTTGGTAPSGTIRVVAWW